MTILNVSQLTKRYDEKCGIFDFNISVEKNDVILLLGPNGAGKTTAFKGILGLVPVEKIKISILGTDVSRREEMMHHVGAMIAKPAFYDYLTGYEHLKMWGLVYKQVNGATVDHLFEKIGLTNAKNKRVGTYSSGMKQRLDLARAVIHAPKLLVLDEPFNGMDIEAKFDLKEMLKAMLSVGHMGIVISSHMAADLESFANKVIIIYEGRTLFNGTMVEVKKSGLTLEAFYLEKLNLYKNQEAS